MELMMVLWHLAHTNYRAETTAFRCLKGQRFEAYLPRARKECRHARKAYVVEKSVFPGYLFVGIDPQQQYGANATKGPFGLICSTPGVARLVRIGDKPMPVPPAVIAALKAREGADGLFRWFKPGDQVRCVEGKFAGFLGLYEGMTDDERVAVLFTIMGREYNEMLPETAIAMPAKVAA
jgi:transcriptional antiterminator RfaH